MALLGLAMLMGCNQSPTERFQSCRERATNGESLETLSTCLSARSVTMLSALNRQTEETDGALEYLAEFDALLDVRIDPESDVDINGGIAFLRTMNNETVVMLKEDGDWRIDVMELRSFWTPLADALEAE